MRIPKLRLLLVVLLGGAIVAGWFGCTRCRSGRFTVPAATSKTLPSSTTTVPVHPRARRATGDHRGHLGGIHHLRQARIIGSSTPRTRSTRTSSTRSRSSVERRQGGDWVPEPYIVSQEGGGTKTIRVPQGARSIVASSATGSSRPPKTRVDRASDDGPEGAGSQWYWDVVGSGLVHADATGGGPHLSP